MTTTYRAFVWYDDLLIIIVLELIQEPCQIELRERRVWENG